MNYLAHSFLCNTQEQLVGQFLQDFIKNQDIPALPLGIQIGITLHRSIDVFTDQDPIALQARSVFAPVVGKYSGAFTDVAFDYFLATDAAIYTQRQWEEHQHYVVGVLSANAHFFPASFTPFLEQMKKHHYLMHYGSPSGIRRSLEHLLSKAKYLERGLPVYEAFEEGKGYLQQCYDDFFPRLRNFVAEKECTLVRLLYH